MEKNLFWQVSVPLFHSSEKIRVSIFWFDCILIIRNGFWCLRNQPIGTPNLQAQVLYMVIPDWFHYVCFLIMFSFFYNRLSPIP